MIKHIFSILILNLFQSYGTYINYFYNEESEFIFQAQLQPNVDTGNFYLEGLHPTNITNKLSFNKTNNLFRFDLQGQQGGYYKINNAGIQPSLNNSLQNLYYSISYHPLINLVHLMSFDESNTTLIIQIFGHGFTQDTKVYIDDLKVILTVRQSNFLEGFIRLEKVAVPPYIGGQGLHKKIFKFNESKRGDYSICYNFKGNITFTPPDLELLYQQHSINSCLFLQQSIFNVSYYYVLFTGFIKAFSTGNHTFYVNGNDCTTLNIQGDDGVWYTQSSYSYTNIPGQKIPQIDPNGTTNLTIHLQEGKFYRIYILHLQNAMADKFYISLMDPQGRYFLPLPNEMLFTNHSSMQIRIFDNMVWYRCNVCDVTNFSKLPKVTLSQNTCQTFSRQLNKLTQLKYQSLMRKICPKQAKAKKSQNPDNSSQKLSQNRTQRVKNMGFDPQSPTLDDYVLRFSDTCQQNKFFLISINLMQNLGYLSVFINSSQYILLDLFIRDQLTPLLYHLYRILLKFQGPVFPSKNQSSFEGLKINLALIWDKSDSYEQTFDSRINPYWESLGISIKNSQLILIQYFLLGSLIIILGFLANYSKRQQIFTILVDSWHRMFEGWYLVLSLQFLYMTRNISRLNDLTVITTYFLTLIVFIGELSFVIFYLIRSQSSRFKESAYSLYFFRNVRKEKCYQRPARLISFVKKVLMSFMVITDYQAQSKLSSILGIQLLFTIYMVMSNFFDSKVKQITQVMLQSLLILITKFSFDQNHHSQLQLFTIILVTVFYDILLFIIYLIKEIHKFRKDSKDRNKDAKFSPDGPILKIEQF